MALNTGETVGAILVAVLGAGGVGALLKTWLDYRRVNRDKEINREEKGHDKLIRDYKELINSNQAKLTQYEKRLEELHNEYSVKIDKLRDDHIDCLSKNAALIAENTLIKNRLSYLEAQTTSIQHKLNEIENPTDPHVGSDGRESV